MSKQKDKANNLFQAKFLEKSKIISVRIIINIIIHKTTFNTIFK